MDEYVKRLQQKAGQGMQAIGGAAKNAAGLIGRGAQAVGNGIAPQAQAESPRPFPSGPLKAQQISSLPQVPADFTHQGYNLSTSSNQIGYPDPTDVSSSGFGIPTMVDMQGGKHPYDRVDYGPALNYNEYRDPAGRQYQIYNRAPTTFPNINGSSFLEGKNSIMGGHQGLSYDPKTVSQFQNPGVPYQVSNPPSGEGTSFPNGYKEALLPYRNDDIEAYLQTLKGYPGKTGDVPGRDVWETGGPAFDKAMQAKQAAQPQSYQGFNFPASMLQQMVPYPSNPAPSNPAPSSPAVNNAAQSQAAQPNQASPMNLKNEFLKFLGLIK